MTREDVRINVLASGFVLNFKVIFGKFEDLSVQPSALVILNSDQPFQCCMICNNLESSPIQKTPMDSYSKYNG